MRCMRAQVHWLLLGHTRVPNHYEELYGMYRENHDRALELAENTADTPTLQWLTGA